MLLLRLKERLSRILEWVFSNKKIGRVLLILISVNGLLFFIMIRKQINQGGYGVLMLSLLSGFLLGISFMKDKRMVEFASFISFVLAVSMTFTFIFCCLFYFFIY